MSITTIINAVRTFVVDVITDRAHNERIALINERAALIDTMRASNDALRASIDARAVVVRNAMTASVLDVQHDLMMSFED